MTVMLIGEGGAPDGGGRGSQFPVPSRCRASRCALRRPIPLLRGAVCVKSQEKNGTFLVSPHVCPGRALVGTLALGGCGNALGAGARLER